MPNPLMPALINASRKNNAALGPAIKRWIMYENIPYSETIFTNGNFVNDILLNDNLANSKTIQQTVIYQFADLILVINGQNVVCKIIAL